MSSAERIHSIHWSSGFRRNVLRNNALRYLFSFTPELLMAENIYNHSTKRAVQTSRATVNIPAKINCYTKMLQTSKNMHSSRDSNRVHYACTIIYRGTEFIS